MKLRVGNSESIVSGLDKVCTQSGHDSSKWRLALRLYFPQRQGYAKWWRNLRLGGPMRDQVLVDGLLSGYTLQLAIGVKV